MTDALSDDDFAARLQAELPRLRRWLRRAAGAEADDLVQETLLRAWRSRAHLDPARPVRPWLDQTARSALSDFRRAHSNRQRVEPPPRETGEIDALAVREELGMLLEKLDPAERECLLRHHHRGQSIAQIAAEIGMPSGTVKSHLYRGRQRLRRTWILGGAMILAVVLTRFLISDTELQAGELITVEISRGAAGVHQPAPSRVERLSTTTAGDGATFSLEVVQERRQYR